MSYYAKHPTLGNKHFESVDRAAMEAAGWVFFPHPEKNMPEYLPQSTPIVTEAYVIPEVSKHEFEEIMANGAEPEKRKPGRPKKVSP